MAVARSHRFWLAVTLLISGCGADAAPQSADATAVLDATTAADVATTADVTTAADVTADADPGADVRCDPVTSEGCEPPLKCTIAVGPMGCGPAGSGGNGESCATGGDAFCAAGFACISSSGGEVGTSVCRAFCHEDTDCPGGGTGEICLALSFGAPPMFCRGVTGCDPFGNGCESGKGCYPALLNDGRPICLDSGTARTGEPCTSISQCKKGSVCIPDNDGAAPTCRDLCPVGGAGCSGGEQCEAILGTAIGVCR